MTRNEHQDRTSRRRLAFGCWILIGALISAFVLALVIIVEINTSGTKIGTRLPHHRVAYDWEIGSAYLFASGRQVIAETRCDAGELLLSWDLGKNHLKWARMIPIDGNLLGVTPDDRAFLYQTPDRRLHVAKTESGIDQNSFRIGHPVSCCVYLRTGRKAVIQLADTDQMLLLDYSKWVVLRRIQGYQSLCFAQLSADGRSLIGLSSPWKGTLIDLRLDKGIARKVFRFSRPSSVAISPDSRFAYFETEGIGFFDHVTQGCIDITAGRRVWWINDGAHDDGVGAIACVKGGRRVVVSRKSDIDVWDTADGSAKAYMADAHGGWVRSITPLGDGTAVITSGDDGALRVWDVETLRELCAYQITGIANHKVRWTVETPAGVKEGSTPIT